MQFLIFAYYLVQLYKLQKVRAYLFIAFQQYVYFNAYIFTKLQYFTIMEKGKGTSSYYYEQKQVQRRNMADMLGINDNDSSNNIKNQNNLCQKCEQYAQALQQIKKKSKSSQKREKKLRNILNSLQEQNNLVMQSTDNAVKDFQAYIVKLQNQICQRDELITKLADDIEYVNIASDNLSQVIEQQRHKIRQIEELHKQQLAQNSTQIRQLKIQILKQISQKSALDKKHRQETRRWEIQKFKLKEEIKSLEEQIEGKEKLINFLSASNNQLRIEVIEIKSKVEVEDVTWATQKRKSILNESSNEFYQEIKKQNNQLKILNKSLQAELKCLIRQTQQIQTALVSTKLERDIYKNKAYRSHSMDSGLYYGSIHHNNKMKIIRSQRYQPNEMSERSGYRQIPGQIRFNRNKTAMASVRTSVSNQILEEDEEKY